MCLLRVGNYNQLTSKNRLLTPEAVNIVLPIFSPSRPHEAGRAVSDTLGNVADALEMKGLSLSPEKTVTSTMFITQRSTTDIPAVTCNGTPIKTVTQARLLGVIVDDQLSWREHVNHLCRKIARNIGALHRSSRQLTTTACRQFFTSATRLHTSTAQKNRLLGLEESNSLHCAGATWQCGCSWPLLVELWLSNIEHLWALQLALMMQKCHLGTAMQDICKKLNRTKHSHDRRGNQSCFTPFRRLHLAQSVSQIVLLLTGTVFLNLFVRAHLIPPLILTFSTLSSNHEVFLL